MKFIQIIFIYELIYLIKCETYKDIKIQEGIVRGRKQISYHETTYYSFEGIPYAKPPVGYLRFQPPVPVDKWNGVLEAFDSRIICPQGGNDANETENCLTLNVYTPTIDPKQLKAVYFYTFGGGYVSGSVGSDTTSSEYLMAHDVVVVTINYRLGLLGFVRFNDPKLNIYGNNGMRDNILALKWVQRNIAKFGGDPNRVTVGGCSSGGRTVHALVLSPLAKGLFHRGIMESGTAMYRLMNTSALDIAKNWQPNITNEIEAFNLFNSSSPVDLYNMLISFTPMGYGAIEIEVDSESPEPFLPKHPREIIKAREYNNVSVLFGYNNEEAIEYEKLAKHPKLWFKNKEFGLTQMLNIKDKSMYPKYLEAIHNFYMNNTKSKLKNFLNMYMDILFFITVYDAADLHFARAPNDNYFYRIALDTKMNYLKTREKIHHIPGTSHADELGYIFKMHVMPHYEHGSVEEIGVNNMLTLWTNFIKTGNPNYPDTRIFERATVNERWLPLQRNYTKRLRNLNIDLKLKMNKDVLERERIDFWLNLRNYGPDYLKLMQNSK